MQPKKLLIISVAAALIVVLAFSSTVIAVPGGDKADPFSQILSILLGIQPTIGSIETKVDSLDTKVSALTPIQILEYREGFDKYTGNGYSIEYVENTNIVSDNPVMFNVWLSMSGTGTVKIIVRTDEGAGSTWVPVQLFELNDADASTTMVSFPGNEMHVSFIADTAGEDLYVTYHVMVEGNAGTTVTVKNPPT